MIETPLARIALETAAPTIRWTEMEVYRPNMPQASSRRAGVHPGGIDRHPDKWRVRVASIKPLNNKARLSADGGSRWFLVGAVPVSDEQGNILK
jgi:hypothetical protein